MSERAPSEPTPPSEADPRFPSGPWTGFFLERGSSTRNWMELILLFREGILTGEGRDRVGPFLVRGRYNLDDGSCRWVKKYIGRHDVFYSGFNEGRGIWGVWEIAPYQRGGFHIWPEAMGDPTQQHLSAEADLPSSSDPPNDPEAVPIEDEVVAEAEAVPAGAGAD